MKFWPQRETPVSEGEVPHRICRILGVEGKKKKSQIPGPGKLRTHRVSISLHVFILALKRHFPVCNLCHCVGWGKLPPEQPPPPAGRFQSEQSQWALPEAQPTALWDSVPWRGGGKSVPRGPGFLVAATSERNFCMIHKVFGSIFNKKGKSRREVLS